MNHHPLPAAFLLLACLLLAPVATLGGDATRALDGTWRYQLDRADAGVTGRWFERELTGRLKLPGSLPGQGIGDPITTNTPWTGGIVDKSWFTAAEYAPYRRAGHVKVPFWLQPETYYQGAAWYQRDFESPAAWSGKRVVLFLERPHWETRVWVDDRLVGTNLSLGTPHEYDLGTSLSAGRHRLTICVDNRMVLDVGRDSHSVSDHTQGNWNGIVGTIELRATPPVWIEDLQIYPDAAQRTVEVRGRIGNATGAAGLGLRPMTLEIRPRLVPGTSDAPAKSPIRLQFPVAWAQNGGTFGWTIPAGDIPDLRLWDEFSPQLYEVTASLPNNGHSRTVTFGMRDFGTDGTQFTINGRKTYLRGTLECCIFPKTGHPPTDVAEWRRLMGVAKAHGLNNLRFHSWCPPEAAFQAADELGLYLHVEASSWANSSTTLGDGKPVDAWVYEETDRILKYYGNHPSFVLMAYGNEPGGKNHLAYLAKYVEHFKARDPRRLWTSGAGWPQLPQNQWHSTPDPRIQGWGQGLDSRINGRAPETLTDYRDYIVARQVPVVSHEIGQWCVYPNFAEMKKYTGYLKPRNFEIFRDKLRAHGLWRQARDFLLASGKLQTLCYKEDIESALRTPGMGGFQLLDLHDFPGQGTALVGVLDPFWEEKGYVTPAEYRRFCNATVPLARLAKRVFTTDEGLTAELEVAHFGPAPLTGAAPTFKLVGDDGKVRFNGQLTPQDVPVGNGVRLSPLNLDLHGLPAPARYKLIIGLTGTPFENDWDLWVYPPAVSPAVPEGITVVEELDAAAQARLDQGEKVLLLIPPPRVKPDATSGKIALGFSCLFWNTAWTGRQAPHTLGILCDPRHPLFAAFPTDFHSNWQWWYLVSRAGAMILDDLPKSLQPTVQVVDDWVTARKLGLVFEAKVGKGKLVVCSIDLRDATGLDPVARQFRRSLLDYMAGRRFQPKVTLRAEQVRHLMLPASTLQPTGAKAEASSAQGGYEAGLAIDGNLATLWHSSWQGSGAGFPHELRTELRQPENLSGVVVWPRQDGNHNGWIKDCAVYVSLDGQAWGTPAYQGTLGNDATSKTLCFPKPVTARFVRLVALSGYADGPWAAVAELQFLPAN